MSTEHCTSHGEGLLDVAEAGPEFSVVGFERGDSVLIGSSLSPGGPHGGFLPPFRGRSSVMNIPRGSDRPRGPRLALVGVLCVVAVLGAACSGGSGGEAEPASTTTEAVTSTTVDDEPLIRSYASVVAGVRGDFEGSGLGCRPVFDCAVDVAVAWDEMLSDFGGLDERPAEIAGLVEDLEAMDADRADLLSALKACSDRTDTPNITCAAKSVPMLQFADEVSAELDAWDPYI